MEGSRCELKILDVGSNPAAWCHEKKRDGKMKNVSFNVERRMKIIKATKWGKSFHSKNIKLTGQVNPRSS